MATRKTVKRSSSKTAITVDMSRNLGPLRIDRYALGQGGLSDRPMIDSHVAELRWLKPSVIRLFIQEYFSVYPAHGKYNWKTLDAAVEAILATGAKPLMSICIKPAVLYPDIHDQDKVHPSDYEEWERLIEEMVRHYNVERRDGIVYWEVFNEPDIGESGGCPCRFKPEDYCIYYEHTVRAIRRADPNAKVGGPALAGYDSPILPALLDHCSAGKSPIDFISWHNYTSDPGHIEKAIRYAKDLLVKHPTLKCETVLDEWNMSLGWETLDADFQPCFILETTRRMIENGLGLSCYYHIRDWHVDNAQFAPFMSARGAAFMTWWWNTNPQFHGLFDFQGALRPAYFAMRMLAMLEGDRIAVDASKGTVQALAAFDPSFDTLNVLVWSFDLKRPKSASVTVAVKNLPGSKWELRRRILNAAAPGNSENDLFPLIANDKRDTKGAFKESFRLDGYGATLLLLRRLE